MDNTYGKEKLFSEFPPVSSSEWMQKITEDLKGNPFKRLIWKTIDGLSINPYYRKEDLKALEYLDAEPDSFPYVRTGKKYLNDWEIRQDIEVADIRQANAKALHALNWGATALCFKINERLSLNHKDFKSLLKGIFFDCVNLNFDAPGKEADILNFLQDEVADNKIVSDRIFGSINIDPLGQFCLNGHFQNSEEEDISLSARLVSRSLNLFPNLRPGSINGQIFHNAGASNTQELAFCLACASEYLNRYTGKGLNVDQIAGSFQLNLATGPLFFIEIAKVRAARLLFARLIKAWEPEFDKSCKLFIHSATSEWNQTIFDPYVNMLRGTTEGVAAALGGADSITISPFDKPFRETTGFSERLARNTQVILKEEAYFDKVIDPAAGSYYIEKITDSLVENAWKLFLDIENQGGFLEALKSGTIQDMINETARQRDMNIATRKEVLLGTNQYPNNTENLTDDYNHGVAFNKTLSGRQTVKPLSKYRGAMAFEELRIKTLKRKNGRPKVFLLTFGSVNWRLARSVFASNFFGCAGYEIIDNIGFNSVEEGITAAMKAKAAIVVLCSADDQYPAIAPKVLKRLQNKALLVIAGYPKDSADELKTMGVEHFIHSKSNVLEELMKFNKILAIR